MSDVAHDDLKTQDAEAETQEVDLTRLAARQAKQVIIFTGDVVTTTAALLISAVSLVAALAWNSFMQVWLPTVNLLDMRDPVIKQLVYALSVTFIAVLTAVLISRLRKRVRGRNLLVS